MSDRLVAGLRCAEVADLAPAFVLGALDPGEMETVRAHLAGCAEAHAEMAELGSAAEALLLAVPEVEPPAALGSRILEAARRDTMGRAAAPAATTAAPVGAAPEGATERTRAPEPISVEPRRDRFGFRRLSRPVWATAGLAAVLAIAILGAQALNLQRERDELAAYERGVAAVLDAAATPGAQLAVLAAGNGQGPAGIAAVGVDGTVKIAVRGLAPTTGSQVYEAWLIIGKNAPQPIGGFAVGSSGAGMLATEGTTADGVIVALTLEPGPNATAPTPPIIVSGAAQAHPA